MENIFALLLVAAMTLIVLRFGATRLFGKRGPDYEKQDALFTPAELRFLHVLRSAVPDEMSIFGKVRVADVLKPVSGKDQKSWRHAFNKITAKHLDFVLCDRESGQLLCAIELNDRSHARPDRQERDRFLAAACQGADFPLLMLPTAREYDVAALRSQIADAVGSRKDVEIGPPPSTPPSKPDSDGGCPRCGGALVRKRATRGKNAGSVFIACSNFPQCRFTSNESG